MLLWWVMLCPSEEKNIELICCQRIKQPKRTHDLFWSCINPRLPVKLSQNQLDLNMSVTFVTTTLIDVFKHVMLLLNILTKVKRNSTLCFTLFAVTGSQLSVFSGTLILSAVCTFYTVIGGIKAVLWADCFQMCLIFVALLAAVFQGVTLVGFGEIWRLNSVGGRLNIFKWVSQKRKPVKKNH